MLLWFPLGLAEDERVRLNQAAATVPGEPLALAVHLAHQNRFAEGYAVLDEAVGQSATEADLARLTQAALLVAEGHLEEGLKRAWEVFPFLALHRTATVMVHLLTAHVNLSLGRPNLAVQAAAQAAGQATTPGSRYLRVPALCLWATALGELSGSAQGAAHAQRALRLASTPLARHWAHVTLSRLLLSERPYEAFQHAQKALATASTAEGRVEGQALTDRAFEALQRGPGAGATTAAPRPARHIHLQLFGSPALYLDDLRLDASRQPRVIRLLCYLLEEPDVALATAAEALLPEGCGGRVKYDDETRRTARIRQDVNRARQLIGDPAAVTCQASTLRLGGGYVWSSDLAQGRNEGTLDWSSLPAGLLCDWLIEQRDDAAPAAPEPG